MLPVCDMDTRDFARMWFMEKAEFTADLRAKETKIDMDKELMDMARRAARPGARMDVRA